MNRLFSVVSFGAVIAGGLVGVAVSRLPAGAPAPAAVVRNVQIPPSASQGRALPQFVAPGVPSIVIGGRNVNTVNWKQGTPPYRFDKPDFDSADDVNGGWMNWAWIVVNSQ